MVFLDELLSKLNHSFSLQVMNEDFLICFPFPAATVCPSLSNLEGEESFEPAMLGQAEEVVQERVCDDELILVKK